MTRLLRLSALLTILALILMIWSLLQPTPLPVMLAMTVGQAVGTIAFGLYGFVVWKEFRRLRRVRRESSPNISRPPTQRGSST